MGLRNENIDMNQNQLWQCIPVEVVVSGGGSSVVVQSGRCAASTVTAAENPVSLLPEVGEDVSLLTT